MIIVNSARKGRKIRIELKSLINGKKTKGSVNNNYNNQLKGATIYALKIKTGYTKKIINWFKKTYKKNIWTNYFNNALSNCSISARLLYFIYENKGKLPTLKDLYGTKIVHHGVSTKKNNRTRKKRGGQGKLTKEQKEQLAKRLEKGAEVIKKRTENLRASPLLNTSIKAELPRLFSPITVPSEKKEKKGGRKRSTKKKTRKKNRRTRKKEAAAMAKKMELVLFVVKKKQHNNFVKEQKQQ